ncbi:MAG: type IV pilus assembly protein PilM [Candidatus Paceibacteria bacterium]|jgi:type IV pilus assembly protein PilM
MPTNKFFSPSVPSYIKLPSIGLDISDTSLKYVALKPGNTSNFDLVDWGNISIPNGTLSRGEVVDPKQLTAVLAECKSKTGAEFIRVSLPEERAYLFETQLKRSTTLSEMRSLLEFRLVENVPIAARDVFFDYTVLPFSSEKDRSMHIAVTAYAKETVQTYYEACLAAGLQPLSFEVEAQAMARSVVPSDMGGAVMLVDFGKTRTGIGIVYKNTLLYTSTIDMGGNQLSTALRKQLGDKPESELTHLKNTEGLIHGAESSLVHDALMTTVSVIKDELATQMQYWHMRTGSDKDRRLQKIILCGGSANLKGLPAYFTESLGVETARGNVWTNTFSLDDFIPPIDQRHSYGYATAVGLALGSKINV